MDQQEGFFSVLRQIKAIENSFMNILMEAAYKMSKLTQSQMFVLIESPEGRTFTGSPNLCQAYSTGDGLFAHDSDVHLGLDDGLKPDETEIDREQREASDEIQDGDGRDWEEDDPDEDRRGDWEEHGSDKVEDPSGEDGPDAFEDDSPSVEVAEESAASIATVAEESSPKKPSSTGSPKEPEPSSWFPGYGSGYTSEVWKYFERSQNRPDIARCSFCRVELKHKFSTLIKNHEIDRKFVVFKNCG